MLLTDTIIAVSSPSGGGGVRGIVRVSGKEAWELAGRVVRLPEKVEAGWYWGLAVPAVHETLGLAGVVLFKGPRSFTGEDVAEIELPDSPAIMRACVEGMLAAGKGRVRLAGPGEFSARAFFNGKMDLTEAEGIAATIGATTAMQLQAAAGLREGRLHREMAGCTERLANLLALVEAGIDFSDEEGISLVEVAKVEAALEQMSERLAELVANSVRVDRLDSPPTVVFIGKPNVGKSSLVNVLSGQERSLVSHIAGTTRDILAATLRTAAGEIRLVDVPGEESDSDELRSKMMEARRLALLEADLVVRVTDHAESSWDGAAGAVEFPAVVLEVQNKADLIPASRHEEGRAMRVSAKSGRNIHKLREAIVQGVGGRETVSAGTMLLNQRHRGLVQEAREAVRLAAGYTRDEKIFRRHPELLAAELRRALDLLGQITGMISPDEVLGRIFSTFCIGK